MREAQSQKHPKGRSHSKGNLKDVASTTHHDLKTDQPHVEAAGIKTRLGASCSIKKLLYLSGRPVVFDRGWRLSMLTVARLHTLEDLPQLVSNLAKLMIDLLAEGLVLRFQAADLLLQPINALRRGGALSGAPALPAFDFPLPLPLVGILYETGLSKISKVFSLTLMENSPSQTTARLQYVGMIWLGRTGLSWLGEQQRQYL